MAKRNIWVLPMNDKYTIIDLFYWDWVDMCMNCWRLISNIAVIKNSEWKVFTVGLDCAKTLEEYEISNHREFKQQEKEYKNFVGRIQKINKAIKDWKVTKITRTESQYWISYSVHFWLVESISSWNVYKRYREKFWEFVEKKFWDSIIKIVR